MEDSLHNIDKSTAEIVMGHLEIKGFEMHKGHLNEQGLDKNLFKRFEKVITGPVSYTHLTLPTNREV